MGFIEEIHTVIKFERIFLYIFFIFIFFSRNIFADSYVFSNFKDYNEPSFSYKSAENLIYLYNTSSAITDYIGFYFYYPYLNKFYYFLNISPCILYYQNIGGGGEIFFNSTTPFITDFNKFYCFFYVGDLYELVNFSVSIPFINNLTYDNTSFFIVEGNTSYGNFLTEAYAFNLYVPNLTIHNPQIKIGKWNEIYGFLGYGNLWGEYDAENTTWIGEGKRSYPYVYVGDIVKIGVEINNTGYGRAINVSGYLKEVSEGTNILENESVYANMLNSTYDPVGYDILETYAVVEFNESGTQTLTFYARNHDDVFNTTYTMEFEVLDPDVLLIDDNIFLKQNEYINISFQIYDNATALRGVYANISYYNVSQNRYVSNFIPLRYYITSHDNESFETNVSIEVTALSSLPQNITFYFDIGKNITLNHLYNVENSHISIVLQPYRYIIMHNQTFNLTFNITAIDGEVAYLNLTLISYNSSIIEISSPYKNISLYLSKGESYLVDWALKTTNQTGIVSLKIKASYYNTTYEKVFVFEVVPVIIDLLEDPYPYSTQDIAYAYVMGNFSPLTSIITKFDCCNLSSFTFYEERTSDKCYTRAFTSQQLDVARSRDGASIIYAQGYVSETPDSAIDGSTLTYWTAESSSSSKAILNISFNGTYYIGELDLLIKSYGDANITINYLSSDGTWKKLHNIDGNPLIITTPQIKKYINISITPVEAEGLSFVMETENVLLFIYEVSALTLSRIRAESCYVYNLTLLTNSSGLNSANLNFIFENYTSKKEIFYNVSYGNVSFKGVSPNVLIYNTQPQQVYVDVFSYNGDLRNLTFYFTSLNTTVINITTDTYYVDYVKNGSNILVPVNITTLLLPDEPITSDIMINVSSPYSYDNNSLYTLTIIQNDTLPPNITNLYLPSYLNMNQSFEAIVEVEENIYITDVVVSCTYSNITIPVNEKITYSPYNLSVHIPSTCIVELPKQTLEFYVKDLSSSYAYAKSFVNTTTTLTILEPDNNKYNRGESIIFNFRYFNGDPLEEATYNFTFNNYLVDTGVTHNIYIYKIPLNISEGNYTYELNISYGKNFATLKGNVYISSHLQLEYITPYEGKSYDAGEDLGIIYIKVKNIRGEEVDDCVDAYLSCLSENHTLHTLKMNESYLEGYGHVLMAMSGSCFAPSDKGVNFELNFYIEDCNNNTYNSSLMLKTFSEIISSASSSGGGSSGGGGSLSSLSIPHMPESREIFSVSPKLMISFDPRATLLKQGENFTLTLVVDNLVDVFYPVEVIVIPSQQDIKIKPLNYSFYLEKSASLSFDISTTFLTYPETKYLRFVVYANGSTYKSYNYSFDVVANVFVRALVAKQSVINEYKQQLITYQKEGLEAGELENMLKEVEETYSRALQALSNNSLLDVMSYDAQLNELLKKVDQKNKDLMFKMIIKNHLSDIIFISFITALGLEILFLYVFPYFYYWFQIRRYAYAVERAKRNKYSLQKQFFMRKIDETTFRRTMEREQAKMTDALNQLYKYKKKIEAYKDFTFLKFRL